MTATTHVPECVELLRAEEVAARLRVTRSMAYKLMRTGQLPAIRIGRAVRVSADELAAYLRRARTPAAGPAAPDAA